MAYAVVSGYTGTGATKTTVNIGGVDYDVYEIPNGGSITFSTGGDVDVLAVGGGGGSGGTGGGSATDGGAGGRVVS